MTDDEVERGARVLEYIDLLMEQGVGLMKLSGMADRHQQLVIREFAANWIEAAQEWLDRDGPRPKAAPAADIPHGLERIMAIGPRRPAS